VQQTEDTTQTARALLLVAGALVGFIGMSRESTTMVYIAIGLLAVGILLAIVRRIQNRRNESL
jgi:hypothetical protein